jgi:hypothetical protein
MVKVRHLISTVYGDRSQHFLKLIESEKTGMYTTSHEIFRKSYSVLLAAKEDYEGGYLNKIRNIIQADVFDNEPEQATELLSTGYETAAAVVAGVVLETTLRQMCEDNHIIAGKLDKMGADLAKAGIFNKLVQKQITAWADIRNSAAHGKGGQFNREDVEATIRDIARFVADRLT